jgi:hypothetical protein
MRYVLLPGLLAATSIAVMFVLPVAAGQPAEPRDIGSRRELFVEGALIEQLTGQAALRLHHPTPREVSLTFDRPWEGSACGYVTVFRDGELYRMYYRGCHLGVTQGKYTISPEYACYAESRDGIHWARPKLGLFEVAGTRANNVILTAETGGTGTHNFCPFLDARPNVPASQRYKALGGLAPGGLYAFVSADGIRWKKLSDKQVITQGAFDSQNVAFWDAERGEYRAYARQFRNGRDIVTCTSKDFLKWTDPTFLEYSPGRTSELYTNQVQPYYRAPHLLLGFPTRYVDRGWIAATAFLPQGDHRRLCATTQEARLGTAVTDGMLMASRDRQNFRIWPESFLRPGLRLRNSWFYGDNYQALGLVETKSPVEESPDELSLYASEATSRPAAALRRYTLRIDGFVSVNAPLAGGEMLTRPLVFRGRELVMNYSTSGAGSIRVEIQNADGRAIPGFSLESAEIMFGDSLQQAVLWKGGSDVSRLAGKPVRLKFEVKDADLYSIRFRE